MNTRKWNKAILLFAVFTLTLIGLQQFAFCHGGGGDGGGGNDSRASDSAQSTVVQVLQDQALADYEEAYMFEQYNDGMDRMDAEWIRFGSGDGDPNQEAIDRAEFFLWLAENAEALGDKLWGGTPNTIEVEGPPGSSPVKIGDKEIPNPGIAAPGSDGKPPSLSDFGPSIVWNGFLNITRTLGYGMLGENNRTVYNINQRSRSGRAINNFIANMDYRGRSIPRSNGEGYNVLGGGLNEAPRAE